MSSRPIPTRRNNVRRAGREVPGHSQAAVSSSLRHFAAFAAPFSAGKLFLPAFFCFLFINDLNSSVYQSSICGQVLDLLHNHRISTASDDSGFSCSQLFSEGTSGIHLDGSYLAPMAHFPYLG
jgi:hypothetical protein